MGASCVRPKQIYERGLPQDSMLLTFLNDDLLTLILSFCATAPVQDTVHHSLQVDFSRIHRISAWISNPLSFCYEPGSSTLTHELPRVCHRFRDICYTSNLLWIDALAKIMLIEQWDLRSFLQESRYDADIVSLAPNATSSVDLAAVTRGLEILCRELKTSRRPMLSSNMSMARFLYVRLWNRSTLTLPGYFSESHQYPMLGDTIHLDLQEPRYQRLMAELVEGRPEFEPRRQVEAEDLNAGRTEMQFEKPYPKFLFVPVLAGTREEPKAAFVSLVKRGQVNADGTGHIFFVPVQVKQILSTQVKPNSHGLKDVTV